MEKAPPSILLLALLKPGHQARSSLYCSLAWVFRSMVTGRGLTSTIVRYQRHCSPFESGI
jgi:hypothetical protein